MIHVEHLTRKFGSLRAVRDISFHVDPGEIVGFLGPNGAGKTTTLRMLSGYMTPSGGEIRIAGLDMMTQSLEARRKIGYLPENVPLYTDMRVTEYLRYRGKLKGIHGKRLRLRMEEVVALCGLADARHRIIGHLSKGYRQRIGLADSLLHEPELLILDEPTVGLDPNQIRNIRTLIQGLSKQHTVLLSSHLLAEVDMICRRVMILDKGRIIASDSPEHLAGLIKGHQRVVAEIRGRADPVLAVCRAIPGMVQATAETRGEWVRISGECAKGRDVREHIARETAQRGWGLRELRLDRKNLEDVFVALTSDMPQPAGDIRKEEDSP